MNRRSLLKMGAAGFASNLLSLNAFAADLSGYRALVCVFLIGGQDGHDLVIPYDIQSNDKFSAIRAGLLEQYITEGHQSRYRDNLFSLQGTGSNPSDGALADGREFALPAEMQGLGDLYRDFKMAIVGNVGPLIEPTTRTTYNNGSVSLPPRLFSHNDQQSTWMASSPEGAEAGWGGRMGDIVQAANANQFSDFTLVSTNGNQVFTTGNTLNGYILTQSGGLALNGAGLSAAEPWRAGYRDGLFGFGVEHNNLFKRDLSKKTYDGLTNSELMRQTFSNTADPDTSFPNTSLGDQLQAVAKMIKARSALAAKRQIFFVQAGGYDTHSNQALSLPALQQQVSDAMTAFYNETEAMGVSDEVTCFTASDFGRTLTPNTSGTDHGWGSHHFVLGGAVNGGQILGNIPEAEVDHEQDVGRGRLIPELSVDQFAFSLARWFGLSESEAKIVLPNSINFDYQELYSLFSTI